MFSTCTSGHASASTETTVIARPLPVTTVDPAGMGFVLWVPDGGGVGIAVGVGVGVGGTGVAVGVGERVGVAVGMSVAVAVGTSVGV